MAKKKKEPRKLPRVHKDLEGFEIKINERGEIISNTSIDKLNEFLNKNVQDKKLMKRDDYDGPEDEDEEFVVEETEEEDDTPESALRESDDEFSDEDEDDDDEDSPKKKPSPRKKK
ncbi:MAG: hypothetical protein LPJ89_02720 [Hymenobacteraceae bacterium]|nr:hypothetical protein [Hymenobacteraceae bacterium]MDX5396999.1 hypothetical protein [Hymenobacteraceae bacterium]MDX5442679.1 hypothetical protein [Hymenobacteraceae bacterium]MDX5513073.1 hypothetical protein [Hymenobacteraceae bacterium]